MNGPRVKSAVCSSNSSKARRYDNRPRRVDGSISSTATPGFALRSVRNTGPRLRPASSRGSSRAVLAIAPTPAAAAKLTKSRIATALRRAGRSRGVEALADEIFVGLRRNTLRQTELVEKAMGRQALALLATLNAACDGADDLEQASAEEFRKHPDYATITSFPGLGELTGARVLAEIGDDRNRFATARALKAYAGSAPVTRASGRTISITHRKIKNDRLAAVGWVWSFGAAVNQGPVREHYRRRREHGDRHTAALRHLFNKMLGQLHHCLLTGQPFDPAKAFNTTSSAPEQAAA